MVPQVIPPVELFILKTTSVTISRQKHQQQNSASTIITDNSINEEADNQVILRAGATWEASDR